MMLAFTILKKSEKSRARFGILKTDHGEIETPSFVPVASQAVVKTLSSKEVEATKSQILIANTFLLHERPGEKIVKRAGGLHEFMQWPRPLMTDSGGFQVFSLGFGRDFHVGKLLKMFPGSKRRATIDAAAKPQHVTITRDGVHFRSPIDGKELFLGPKESIRIQEALGADIIFAFDECTAPLVTSAYAREALDRTHAWAKQCLEAKRSTQALFGIVQGSRFKSLREQSARFIGSLPFDGFGIGGDLGSSKVMMGKVLSWTIPRLPDHKPRHLLGIGYPEDMEFVAKHGIDLFDCTVPTHYARHGVAFTSQGKLGIRKAVYLRDKNPLDRRCDCAVCGQYRRNYIAHLIRANEMTGMKLLTFHNLYFFNTRVAQIRAHIKNGTL